MLHHVTLEIAPGDAGPLRRAARRDRVRASARAAALGDGYRWFERSGTQVHLAFTGEPDVPAVGHAAFVVAPLEPAVERLAGLGFEVSERRRHWGARRVVVAAPAGHRIELMETPPGQAGSGPRGARAGRLRSIGGPLRYPIETFTRGRANRSRTPLQQPRSTRVRADEPAGDGQGRAVRPLFALFRDRSPALPRGVRRRRASGGAPVRRRRGRAGGAALRARLHRLRRRLGRPGRRRPRRLRVGLQRPHQGPAARPPRRLPRAVDPLHPLRQAARPAAPGGGCRY